MSTTQYVYGYEIGESFHLLHFLDEKELKEILQDPRVNQGDFVDGFIAARFNASLAANGPNIFLDDSIGQDDYEILKVYMRLDSFEAEKVSEVENVSERKETPVLFEDDLFLHSQEDTAMTMNENLIELNDNEKVDQGIDEEYEQ
jgi:hypothetical protein